MMLKQNSSVSSSGANKNGRHQHQQQQDDDDEGGKKDKPRGTPTSTSTSASASFLTQIKNSPPAPPLSIQQALCRRRRRSDLLLFLIGVSICILSVLHIAWHSDSLPHHHSQHSKYPANGGKHHDDKSMPRLKFKGKKSALQLKLDEFVKVKERNKKELLQRVSQVKEENKKDAHNLHFVDKDAMARMRQNSQNSNGSIMQPTNKVKQNVTPSQSQKGNDGERVVVHKQTTKQNENEAYDVPPKHSNKEQTGNIYINIKQTENIPKAQESSSPPQPLLSKNTKEEPPQPPPHPVAHLNCADHGGPHNQRIIDEMVFWSDIPSDSSYLSPMHPLNDPYTSDDTERFLTFEPDHGGWNNIRMAMETALVMSHAMGRTLVLPPEQRMYLLDKSNSNQQSSFSFADFFHLDAISIEHKGFKVITMEEFLTRVAEKGELKDFKSGGDTVVYPPKENTNGGGRSGLWNYLRTVGNAPEWEPWDCALAIPSSTNPQSIVELNTTLRSIMDGTYNGKPKPILEEFNGNPTPVNASMAERMREMLADRNNLCIYDKPLQESILIHLKVEKGVRLLTHFYAFIFFADWKQDLWSKRFVRDHLRYVDEIICAAARVVEAVRNHARKNNNHTASHDEGTYDAMHVRRGDFQFPPAVLPADKLYHLSRGELAEGATLYVATDERNKSFFDIFKNHYDVVFLDDFLHAIPGINTNYYGMIDQLVAYKSRSFYGTWWSTLSGYVNRMRGYYIAKHKLEGYKDGTMKSWYFTPEERVLQMRSYIPVRKPIYCREFPVSWRDIDQGIDELSKQ